ncbi:MAG: MFS transporter [Candidatus Heimdallarchaeota archaeon]|nr:MFS transporter [Candidatus Heimdallarchaeota archaeon]
MNTLDRNTGIYYFSKIGWLALYVTAVVLTWQLYGLSFSQILLLQGLFGLFMFILEFPSGVLADITSRKNVVAFGHLCIAFGTLLYATATSFGNFLLAEATLAMGLASISGSDTANIWDTYLEYNEEATAKKIIARGRSINIITAAILISLGGFASQIYLALPFHIVAVISAINALLWFSAHEPLRVKKDTGNETMRETLYLLNNPKFLEALFGMGIISISLRIAFWAYIPQMQRIELEELYFGVYIGVGASIAGLTSWLISTRGRYSNTLLYLAYIASFIGILFFTLNMTFIIFILALALQQFARGVLSVVVIIQTNEVSGSDVRASAVSLISSLGSIMYLLFTVSIDLFHLSFDTTMRVNVGTISIILIILLVIIFKIQKQAEV